MNMNYEEFALVYTTEMQQSMKNVEITRGTFVKVNEALDGLSFKYPDYVAAPTIYIKDKYEMYQKGYTLDEIVEKTIEQVNNAYKSVPEIPFLTIESAKENLYCAVINLEANKELLTNVPHEKFNDLAIIARFNVHEDASFIVNNSVCSYLKMTSEEVLEIAKANIQKQKFECKNINEVISKIIIITITARIRTLSTPSVGSSNISEYIL